MEDTRISKNRILHMHGVAEYMHEHAPEYGLDPEQMYLLGLVHDIGYIHSKYDHEKNGANILKRAGFVNADLVENHGNNPQNYVNDYISSARKIPKELVLLWEADMLIDSKDCPGEVITFEERLASVARKCGVYSEQYRNKKAKMDWLRKYMNKYKVNKAANSSSCNNEIEKEEMKGNYGT